MDFRSTIEWVDFNPRVQDNRDTSYIRRRFFGWLSVFIICTLVCGCPFLFPVEKVGAVLAQTIAYLPFWIACEEGR